MRLVEVGTPVTVGSMTVEPRDIIHGDEHGVLNIPADALPAIFDKAELIRADEQNVVGWSRSDEFTLEGLLALKRVLRHLVDKRGVTVVLSSPVPELVEEIADRILILKDGAVLAFDSLDGLQRMTGTRGNLGRVLEHLIFPETTRNLAQYFEDYPA